MSASIDTLHSPICPVRLVRKYQGVAVRRPRRIPVLTLVSGDPRDVVAGPVDKEDLAMGCVLRLGPERDAPAVGRPGRVSRVADFEASRVA